MNDVLGVTIKVGDIVAYAVRRCNSGALLVGEVLAIELKTNADPYNPTPWEQLKVQVDGGSKTSAWVDPNRMVVVVPK